VLPVEILREVVESYAPYLQASGEMHDPVFQEPTRRTCPSPASGSCATILMPA
jgi:hypothetical protein